MPELEGKKMTTEERKVRFSEVSENTFTDVVKSFFYVMLHKKKTTVGLVIVLIFILMAVFGPVVVAPAKVDYKARLLPPSIEHPLGTDASGRDTMAQFIYGSRNVLLIAFMAAFFTLLIAMVVGMMAGLLGGAVDSVLTFLMNLILTIPSLPIMMLLSMIMKIDNPIVFGLLLAMWSWAGLGRAIRSQVLSIKNRDFVEAARILGMSNGHIIFKEMLPSITSYLAMNFIFTMRGAIMASVNLMLLGLVPFSASHWGMMIQLALSTTGAMFGSTAIIYFLTPVVGIALFGMGCFFFASGLDEALNPRLRTQGS